MKSVFISYSSRDQHAAATLRNCISGAGYQVFEYSVSLAPGTEGWDDIVRFIKQCDVFVAVISRHSVRANATKLEIDIVYRRYGNERAPLIIPVLLDNTPLPTKLELFTPLPAIDVEAAASELVQAIGEKKVLFSNLARRARRKPQKMSDPDILKYLTVFTLLAVGVASILAFWGFQINYDNHPTQQTLVYSGLGACGGVLVSVFMRHPSIVSNWKNAKNLMIFQAFLRIFFVVLCGGALALFLKSGVFPELIPESRSSDNFPAYKALLSFAGALAGFLERLIPEFDNRPATVEME